MAYIKKNWEDLPSEATPIEAADLNHIENGIDLSHKYIVATAGSNGDFIIDVGDYITLTNGTILRVSFPAATNPASNARLSIDNGVSYVDIAPNGFVLKSAQVENNTFIIVYDGTQWTFSKGTLIPIYDQNIVDLQNGYGTSDGFKGEASVMTYLNARNQFKGLRIEVNVNGNARELAVVESMFFNTSGFMDLTSGRFNGAGTEIALTAIRLDVDNSVGITILQFDEILFPSLTKIENSINFQIVRIFGII